MTGIRLLAAARHEYLQAVRYYRNEVDDLELGRDFIAKFRERVERMQRVRAGGALVIGIDAPFEIRRAKLRRFPFHIFFAVLDDEIVVIAIPTNADCQNTGRTASATSSDERSRGLPVVAVEQAVLLPSASISLLTRPAPS